jgi:hypothetical protein
MSEQWYLWGCIVMGMIQVLGALLWLVGAERFRRIILVGSLFEYGWAGVSYWMTREPAVLFPLELPVAFIAYTLAFMAAGVVLAIQSRDEDEPQIPAHIIWAGGQFGAGFASMAGYYAFTMSVAG